MLGFLMRVFLGALQTYGRMKTAEGCKIKQ